MAMPIGSVEAGLAAGAVRVAGDTVAGEGGHMAVGRDAPNRVIAGVCDVEHAVTIDRQA